MTCLATWVHDFSKSRLLMKTWSENDRTHLLQKIILLQLLNKVPEKPSKASLVEWEKRHPSKVARCLTLQREKQLVKSLVFLASAFNDPKKVLAICVEEGEAAKSLTVQLAVNHGDLPEVEQFLRRLSDKLEHIARGKNCHEWNRTALMREAGAQKPSKEQQTDLLNEALRFSRNRILITTRSRHSDHSQSSFKAAKQSKTMLLLHLNKLSSELSRKKAKNVASEITLLDDLRETLAKIEVKEKNEVFSEWGLERMVQIVSLCYDLRADGGIARLLRASSMPPSTKAYIEGSVTKLSRFRSITRFLTRAAFKIGLFRTVDVAVQRFGAPGCPQIDPDGFTVTIAEQACRIPDNRNRSSTFRKESADLCGYLSKTAALHCPVHAEIQLLYHYEGRQSMALPPRVISSSKQACLLCNLYFCLHDRFLMPGSHGRVYERWALPRDDALFQGETKERTLQLLHSFTAKVEGLLDKQVSEESQFLPEPFESAVFSSSAGSESTIRLDPAAPMSVTAVLTQKPEGSRNRPDSGISVRVASEIASTSGRERTPLIKTAVLKKTSTDPMIEVKIPSTLGHGIKETKLKTENEIPATSTTSSSGTVNSRSSSRTSSRSGGKIETETLLSSPRVFQRLSHDIAKNPSAITSSEVKKDTEPPSQTKDPTSSTMSSSTPVQNEQIRPSDAERAANESLTGTALSKGSKRASVQLTPITIPDQVNAEKADTQLPPISPCSWANWTETNFSRTKLAQPIASLNAAVQAPSEVRLPKKETTDTAEPKQAPSLISSFKVPSEVASSVSSAHSFTSQSKIKGLRPGSVMMRRLCEETPDTLVQTKNMDLLLTKQTGGETNNDRLESKNSSEKQTEKATAGEDFLVTVTKLPGDAIEEKGKTKVLDIRKLPEGVDVKADLSEVDGVGELHLRAGSEIVCLQCLPVKA